MAQHDYVIANDTAANVRSDLNDALSAIVSQNSGASAPSTTYANMLWYDTSNNILKMRSEADDAWIDLGTLNQSTNEFEVANLTELTPTQAEDDTDTTFGLVSGSTLSGVSPVKAWVHFDGTGTVAIKDSHNVSSITDNGTGDYDINFMDDFVDVNYAPIASVGARSDTSVQPYFARFENFRLGAVRVRTAKWNGSAGQNAGPHDFEAIMVGVIK